MCLKNTIRDLCGGLPNTSFHHIVVLADCTGVRRLEKMPRRGHQNEWGLSELVCYDCHCKAIKGGWIFLVLV